MNTPLHTRSLRARPETTARQAGPLLAAGDGSAGQPLPAALRRALELLSGFDLRAVRVHRASALPARLGARAFAFGERIFLGPGAEDALAHEAWHVVQQMQGRVRATGTVNGLPLNDDAALEAEAEGMGERAVRVAQLHGAITAGAALRRGTGSEPVVQRVVTITQGEEHAPDNWRPLSWDAQQTSAFRQAINHTLELNDFDLPRIGRIASDLIREDRTFPTWEDLRTELFIRDCGYEVVSELEALMRVHRPAYDQLEQEMVQWERNALQQLLQDQQSTRPRSDWDYADAAAITNDRPVVRRRRAAPILEWTNPSYTNGWQAHQANYQMNQWLGGVRQDDPVKMNCWETILYALVRTRRVGKGYITWANEKYEEDDIFIPRGHERPLRLAGEVLKVMDCFFASRAEVTAERGRTEPSWISGPERVDFPAYYAARDQVCVPRDMVIPRGRLLFFQAGDMLAAHVAISTGRTRAIQNAAQAVKFGTTMGHEIIENDSAPGTLRYSTIEDMRSYLDKTLVVAPFPICRTTRNSTYTVTIPPSVDEINDRIDRQRDDIDNRTADQKKNAANESTRALKEIDEKIASGSSAFLVKQRAKIVKESQVKLEKLDDAAIRQKEMLERSSSRLKMEKENSQTRRFVLSYDREDPYEGAIQLTPR